MGSFEDAGENGAVGGNLVLNQSNKVEKQICSVSLAVSAFVAQSDEAMFPEYLSSQDIISRGAIDNLTILSSSQNW